ncbi:hypothetical protein [Actinoplanes palleronii]|uniref:hypothetical protein n=1 Tax=Actinoplanes palleronii TaxID=113570 RepID=UPI001943ED02|nr:hypothetical protein [Actinoplanes palleronii]
MTAPEAGPFASAAAWGGAGFAGTVDPAARDPEPFTPDTPAPADDTPAGTEDAAGDAVGEAEDAAGDAFGEAEDAAGDAVGGPGLGTGGC